MNIKPPPFSNIDNPDRKKMEDSGGYFPSLEEAKIYSEGVTNLHYHKAKNRTVNHLMKHVNLPPSPTVLDFGIGDGDIIKRIDLKTPKIIGIDISNHMCDIARENLKEYEFQSFVGSVNQLENIENETVDLVLVIHALGYLTKKEEISFYQHMNRILKKNGYLLILTGNELLDLFALNSGTAEFFNTHFEQNDASTLLKEGTVKRWKQAPRKNPFNYREELKSFDLKEIAQCFSNWHKMIPAIANKQFKDDLFKAQNFARDYDFDPMSLDPKDYWKAYFRCSVYGSLSQK